MITPTNFRDVLEALGFVEESDGLLVAEVNGARMAADFGRELLEFPEGDGLKVHERQTCNFTMNENFVVFECVHRLLAKGYVPRNLELEPRWQLGHGSSGGRADILVRDNTGRALLLIECKTPGAEFDREWRRTQAGQGQLFSYAQQVSELQFLSLYASDFDGSHVTYQNQIIAHRDNETYLAENAGLASFQEASTAESRYNVWRDTYKLDATTKGIFEESIQPYRIGKEKYTVDDLSAISEADRKRKYNEFATILRQHNVSGRENAFDKLVNLLLCKVVDESTNGDDLQFYWKGVAYDTPIELLDRLQRLYQSGMAKFLGEDITYINKDDVLNALRFVNRKPDATQNAVWQLFVQQKFYTNNDFSFIDVHNEHLFRQNADVLIQILRMWQDVRLTTDGASFNQFLGDMFEGFLDQGVKQSEGQFFTPMPLTRFIIQALPLKALLAESEPPRTLDFACGAGHFLTEYAVQAASLLRARTSSVAELHDVHSAVYGIEKEYRLSKVAKVSTFMYGQPGINIIYGDALSQDVVAYPDIKPASFDLIVANPPYSVKGFMETLTPEDRAAYALTKTIDEKSLDTNNKIEAFFVERAAQLLRPGGIAAIVLPSSILSNNDRPTRAARDILLNYFELLAIVELGAGAFGSTSTSTVTAFIRRRQSSPESVDHVRDRVAAWFRGDAGPSSVAADGYDDNALIDEYATHIDVDPAAYRDFVGGRISDDLMSAEVFEGYRSAYEADSTIKRWRSSAQYRALSMSDRDESETARFLQFVCTTERQKIEAFYLARLQSEPVLVVRSPSATKAMKRFLGYGWSRAKGKEGIKLIRDAAGNHMTPLYDELDRGNPAKISSLIASNFTGALHEIPEPLRSFAALKQVEELLDFREPEFDRAISLTREGAPRLESKFPLVKLSTIATNIGRGASPRPIDDYLTDDPQGVPWIKIGDAPRGAKTIVKTAERVTEEGAAKSRRVSKGDLVLSNSMSAGRPYVMGIDGCVHDGWLTLSGLAPSVSADYLFYVLSDEFVQAQFRDRSRGPVVKNLNITRVKGVRIPLADDKTQARLVAEALKIDERIGSALKNLEDLQADLLARVSAETGNGTVRLDRVARQVSETVVAGAADAPARYIGLEQIESGTGFLSEVEDDDSEVAQSNKSRFSAGQVLYGKLRPRLNKVYLTDAPGMCSTDLLVLDFPSLEAAAFFSIYMRTAHFNSQVVETVTNTMPRTSWEKMGRIPVPDLSQDRFAYWFEAARGYVKESTKLKAEIERATGERGTLVRRIL